MNARLISLASTDLRRYGQRVRGILHLLWLVPAVSIVSCGRKTELVVITTEREFIAQYDQDQLVMEVPLSWRRTGNNFPGSAFRSRILNYQFGEAGGEIYLSNKIGGNTLSNVNRWLEEYGSEKIENTDSLELIPVMNVSGFLVETTGLYKGIHENWSLLAVVVESSHLEGFTIKMVGPADEVEANREHFLQACKTLTFIEGE